VSDAADVRRSASPSAIAAPSDSGRAAGAPEWARGARPAPAACNSPIDQFPEENGMLKWALIFFIVSLVAGVFGFTGIAAGAAAVAKILFYVAVALFLVFLVLGLLAMRAIK
jgi:uncharacterized membrane protein YtjA (UPF0391 family)